jgi:hypothetical protein
MTVDLASGGTLSGQQVGYKYLVPTTGSVQEILGTLPLQTGTFFIDVADGITVVIGASTITVINDSPLAFANGAFNGPDLVFSGVDILNAAIDPISAADFQGALSYTPDSIAINFANFLPLAGHALVIDVTAVPEPGSLLLLGLPIAGLAWVRRDRARPAPRRQADTRMQGLGARVCSTMFHDMHVSGHKRIPHVAHSNLIAHFPPR